MARPGTEAAAPTLPAASTAGASPAAAPAGGAAGTGRAEGPPRGQPLAAVALPADEPAAAPNDEEPILSTPTSFTLDLRHARAPEALEEPPVADPDSALTLAAGDRDVRWEVAAGVGDETPGGDNPTPDQDVVDLIGRSLGVEYDDNEELRGADKIAERDRHRWELDPASAEDYRERKRS